MSKYTPGPWNVAIGSNASTTQIWAADGVTHVASLKGSRSVSEANARLIAAAPEMLEALKYVIRQLESGDRVRADDVLDAIAKAEGA